MSNTDTLKVTHYKRNWGLVSLYKSEQARRGSSNFQFEAAQASMMEIGRKKTEEAK